MFWYSHLLKNFPQFVVIHTIKGFSIVNETKIDVLLEFSCLFYDPTDIGNFISGSYVFSKPSLKIWKFLVYVLLKPRLENLDITLLACEMSAIVWEFEHSLALPFLRIGMKTDLFQFCGHCWVFQMCWHIECSTFTAPSLRIQNSSAGIPSPPLALFVVMLPKAHLTSHSRMSGSTPSWLSGSLRSFFVWFCVFLPPFLSIFCFCYVHTFSVLYCAHLFMKCSLIRFWREYFFNEFNFLSKSWNH